MHPRCSGVPIRMRTVTEPLTKLHTGRLKRVQGRADLELLLTELPFERKFARQVGNSNHGNSSEGYPDEADYDDEFEYY